MNRFYIPSAKRDTWQVSHLVLPLHVTTIAFKRECAWRGQKTAIDGHNFKSSTPKSF